MEIQVEKITKDNFAEFGSVLDPYNCGEALKGYGEEVLFHPDKMPLTFAGGSVISVCPLIIKKRSFDVEISEYHEFCEEVIGAFNADVIFHVGLPSEKPDLSKFKAFYLPKNCFSRLKRKVWHGAPWVIKENETQGWVLLPPYTYTCDCVVVKHDKVNLKL